MEHQQSIAYQLDLFTTGQSEKVITHSDKREDVNGTQEGKGKQVLGEGRQGRALTEGLMRIICSSSNLKRAYKQVKRNKGAAGIDNMAVGDFAKWFNESGETLIEELLGGRYEPQAVKQVEIPKPKGGFRKLGIPTVTDRIIQQAIAQVLVPIYERKFSKSSYGFRPKRSAHMALEQASEYVAEGRDVVVDMDLKSFFDEVNHDRLMYRLSSTVKDKTLLRLIRRYLQSGILTGSLISQRQKGTPQGSPLSPLLSNIVLDELDKELEKRGHSFVRYADDFVIFVRSQKAGERVKESVGRFIKDNLKLKVSETKSKVCHIEQATFLGHTILGNGMLVIAKGNILRLKMKVRKITQRNRGRSFEQIVSEINFLLRGWLQYFRHTKSTHLFRNLDGWIRRKLRCYKLKQKKRPISVQRFLKQLGVATWHSWTLAVSGKGWWRKSGSPQSHQAMNLKWFEEQGLFNLSSNYKKLNNYLKPPCARACTVV